jgi:hypothetical protein
MATLGSALIQASAEAKSAGYIADSSPSRAATAMTMAQPDRRTKLCVGSIQGRIETDEFSE